MKAPGRKTIKDLATALSLANLCLLYLWASIVGDQYNGCLLTRPYQRMDYLVLIAMVFILGLVFFAGNLLARRLRRPGFFLFRSLVFLAAVLSALNGIRLLFPNKFALQALVSAHGKFLVYGMIGLLALSFFMLLKTHLRPVISAMVFGVLILSPLAVINVSRAAWFVACGAKSYQDKEIEPWHATRTNGNRALVLLFDELDQAQLFENRAVGLSLPALDDFKKNSFYAPNAFPPAGGTSESLPSLINGRVVSAVKFVNHSEVRLRYEGSTTFVSWGAQGHLFRDLYGKGFHTAIVGWFFPYSRILKGANYSRWFGSVSTPSGGILARMLFQSQALLYIIPGSRFFFQGQRVMDRQLHRDNYERMHREVISLAVDPRYNLLFVHWPIPHPPYIFDRQHGRFTREKETGTYQDNLALVDRTLNDVRETLAKRGLWDQTTVIVTSDHGWRTAPHVDHRVPFLVKMPFQRGRLTYPGTFNTVILHDLIIGVLQGRIAGAQGLSAWLKGREGRAHENYLAQSDG